MEIEKAERVSLEKERREKRKKRRKKERGREKGKEKGMEGRREFIHILV